RLGIHLVLIADDAIEVEQVRGDGIDLVVGERLWLGVRHRPAHVVEDGRRVRPVAADRPHRRLAGKAPLAADETIVWLAAALDGVTGLAPLLVDDRPLQRGAAARRQPDAIGTVAAVHAG